MKAAITSSANPGAQSNAAYTVTVAMEGSEQDLLAVAVRLSFCQWAPFVILTYSNGKTVRYHKGANYG